MGTNYYLHEKEVNVTEENASDGIHIGKSSAGWKFHFQSQPFGRTFREMMELIKLGKIYDEYGEYVTYEDFVANVVFYKERGDRKPPDDEYNYTSEGFTFSKSDFS